MRDNCKIPEKYLIDQYNSCVKTWTDSNLAPILEPYPPRTPFDVKSQCCINKIVNNYGDMSNVLQQCNQQINKKYKTMEKENKKPEKRR